MNKQDVIAILGEPDRIVKSIMTSDGWLCSTCAKLFIFDVPVKLPAPCECGGIAFEKRDTSSRSPLGRLAHVTGPYACGECGKPIKTGCYCKACSTAQGPTEMPLCGCESPRQCRGAAWAARDGMRCSQASGGTKP